MITNIANVGFKGDNAATVGGAPKTTQPQNTAVSQQPKADTVEISEKEKPTAKSFAIALATVAASKVILGSFTRTAVAMGALFGLSKTGVLKNIENPEKWYHKLNNFAYKGGNHLVNGVDYFRTSAAGQFIKEKAIDAKDYVKGFFSKNKTETTPNTESAEKVA